MSQINHIFKQVLGFAFVLALSTLAGCNDSSRGENEPNDPPKEPTSIRIISYNLKNAESDLAFWDVRKKAISDYLKEKAPNVIGLQEADDAWVSYLQSELTDYELYSVPRAGEGSEAAAIFYQSVKYTLLDSGTFWLSETPGQQSIGWDSSTYRISSYVILQDNVSEEQFAHFNTHLDHIGTQARANGLSVILERMKALDIPTFVTGDFNLLERSSVYKEFLNQGYLDTKYEAENIDAFSSINWFIPQYDTGFVIDFIFVEKDEFSVLNYEVDIDDTIEFEGKAKPISDHYPIVVDVLLMN